MPLFEAAILELPEKKKKGPKIEKLIFGPEPLIAKDDKAAAMKLLIDNAEDLKDYDPDRIQVLIRPFG